MARRSLPEMAQLTVRIPRGHAGFWSIIRELDTTGPWSVPDVDRGSNVDKSSIADYVRRLVRGGYARQVDEVRSPSGPIKRYRLTKRPGIAPSLRRDGTPVPLPAQQRMWTAIRSMRQFTAREVAFAASVEQAAVPVDVAKRYFGYLDTAGYLATVNPGAPGRGAVYRLKPAMNTGPLAPSILRVKLVWDPNRAEIIGDRHEAVEFAP